MISIEAQQKLLLNIARRLKKPIIAYAIGGTAMMFMGFKDSTLDIDIVFENNKERSIFEQAVKDISYKEMDSVIVYGARNNQPKMFTLGDERLDLFLTHVIDFEFSKAMQKRADQIHQFENNFQLKIANPHDIILMKCATDRKKDMDDARNIINNFKINWNILIDEAKNQIKLGRHTAAFDLGDFLEKLKNEMKVNIPNETLNMLFDIVKNQAEEKQRK